MPHRVGSNSFEHEKDRADILGKLAETLLALAQRLVRPFVSAPNLGILQRPIHCRYQARQPILHQIIIRACLHRRHSDFFANVPGDNDKGYIEAALVK